MEISSLDVSAPIQLVGLDNEGRVATIPGAETIAWYRYGAASGAQGNAILAGHRDWKGKLGSFGSIERLNLGEIVIITFADGTEPTFKVVSNNTYLMDEVPESVMELKGEAKVTSIICTGKYDKVKGGYQSRVVVVIK